MNRRRFVLLLLVLVGLAGWLYRGAWGALISVLWSSMPPLAIMLEAVDAGAFVLPRLLPPAAGPPGGASKSRLASATAPP